MKNMNLKKSVLWMLPAASLSLMLAGCGGSSSGGASSGGASSGASFTVSASSTQLDLPASTLSSEQVLGTTAADDGGATLTFTGKNLDATYTATFTDEHKLGATIVADSSSSSSCTMTQSNPTCTVNLSADAGDTVGNQGTVALSVKDSQQHSFTPEPTTLSFTIDAHGTKPNPPSPAAKKYERSFTINDGANPDSKNTDLKSPTITVSCSDDSASQSYTAWNTPKSFTLDTADSDCSINLDIAGYEVSPSTVVMSSNIAPVTLSYTKQNNVIPGWPLDKVTMGSFLNPLPTASTDPWIAKVNRYEKIRSLSAYSPNNWKPENKFDAYAGGNLQGLMGYFPNKQNVFDLYVMDLSGDPTEFTKVLNDKAGMINSFERALYEVRYADYAYEQGVTKYPTVFLLSPDYLGELQKLYASGSPCAVSASGGSCYTPASLSAWVNKTTSQNSMKEILTEVINNLSKGGPKYNICNPVTETSWNDADNARECLAGPYNARVPSGKPVISSQDAQKYIDAIPAEFNKSSFTIKDYNRAIEWIMTEFGNNKIPYAWEDADWAGTTVANGWFKSATAQAVATNAHHTADFLDAVGAYNSPQNAGQATLVQSNNKTVPAASSFIAFDKNGQDLIYVVGGDYSKSPSVQASAYIWNHQAWENYINFVTQVGAQVNKKVMLWQLNGAHLPLNSTTNAAYNLKPSGAAYPEAAIFPHYVFGVKPDDLADLKTVTLGYLSGSQDILNIFTTMKAGGIWETPMLSDMHDKGIFAIQWGSNAGVGPLPEKTTFDDHGWLENQFETSTSSKLIN